MTVDGVAAGSVRREGGRREGLQYTVGDGGGNRYDSGGGTKKKKLNSVSRLHILCIRIRR